VEGINVYHFLGGAFCQCVSIAKVVNFYVFDVVTICDILYMSPLNVVVLGGLEDFRALY